ncbi:MAG TPA: recombination protein O N-terminal domain-containing protein [Candidatus Paceibacterota bacterium]|jgi:recombinational DNA repair protein (RecF pathway)|nr:recombination protein O N-terminal domain-containing protein [Candidatus Paceibacterota bacterium]
MYQKYQTEALVLGSRESGESDRSFSLYTKEFGLVRARASAVRTEHSRMRYALQNYALANVSLVRGKRGWRVAGATALKSAVGDTRGVSSFARTAELTLRLVHGEERNEYLFAALAEAHRALMQPVCDAHAVIEIVCVARLLYALGYISSEALSTALFTHTAYTGESLLEAETMKDTLLSSINRAIAETQL